MNKDLSDLLAAKDFEQLTFAEQELVLTELSMAEYSSQREMIVTAQIVFAEEAELLKPKPAIALAVVSTLRKEQKAGIFALFTHKVPAWAALAACALVLFLFNYSAIFEQTVKNNNTALIPLVDTVYIEKVITEFRDIKSLEPSHSMKTPPSKEEAIVHHTPIDIKVDKIASYSDEMLSAEQVNYAAILQNYSTSSGVSLRNDSLTRMLGNTIF